MAILKSLGSGLHADVAWLGRRLHVVLAGGVGRWLTFEEDGTLAQEERTPGRCLFPRTNGRETIYSDDYHFRLWRGTVPEPSGRPAGNCPVEIGRHGVCYWQVMINGEYLVRTWAEHGGVAHVRYGAPTGLWESDDYRNVQLWDEAFHDGTRHEAGGITVGERKDGDGCIVIIDGRHRHLCPEKWVYWPRIAMREDNRIAIAWHDEKAGTGAWLWIGTPDELRALPLVPEEVPPPVVSPPQPEPETPPTQEQTMKFTDAEKSLLIAFGAAFPLPADGNDEEARRAWTMKLAQTFKARVGGWGTKKQGPSNPQSKDAIARWIAGTLWSFDTQVARDVSPGIVLLALNPNAEGEDITGQHFIEVAAHDWLATVPPQPPPPPEPEVPPAGDLEARVAALEAWARTVKVSPF